MKKAFLFLFFVTGVMLFRGQAEAQAYGDWVYCANENGVCYFQGRAQVRYGANGVYAYQEAYNQINCNNNTFGDPIYGVVKQCWFFDERGGGGGHRPPPGGGGHRPPPYEQWVYCAQENGQCYLPRRGVYTVRYGARGRYSYLDVRGQIPCNNNTFGDPIYGVVKACEYLERR